MLTETRLHPDDIILPMFFSASASSVTGTSSMPGVPIYPSSGYKDIAMGLDDQGVNSVLLFGTPANKDVTGSEASSADGTVQKAIFGLRSNSDVLVIADLCLCGYTDHGHCGLLLNGAIDNDATLARYAETAISLADAGADMIAPSGMMDHQVGTIRKALDDSGHRNIPIMAYSAKFNSSFYGPFRNMVDSSPSCGDRSSYQISVTNRREAMEEIELDIIEGADVIMIKPAMPCLDIIREARETLRCPIAAYQVSGEYAMIKAAAEKGWIDEQKAMMESLLSIKRAGADMVITYFAEEAVRIIRCSNE